MTIHRIWNDLAQDDSGQDLIEYALITGLIGAAAVATLGQLATAITGVLNSIKGSLNTVPGATT